MLHVAVTSGASSLLRPLCPSGLCRPPEDRCSCFAREHIRTVRRPSCTVQPVQSTPNRKLRQVKKTHRTLDFHAIIRGWWPCANNVHRPCNLFSGS